jgi:hypothetical protein
MSADDWGAGDAVAPGDWGHGDAAVPEDWGHGDEVVQHAVPPAHADTFWGDLAKKYWPNQEDLVSRDPQLALRAKIASTQAGKEITPQELNAENEGRAGEFLKGAPVLGASVPQTDSMTKFEAEHPTQSAVARGLGGVVGTAPLLVAAPEAFGAEASFPWYARSGLGATTNAAISAADTKARGGSELDAAKNAGLAAGIGGFSPLAGAAGRGISDAASTSTYAGPIIKNMVSRPLVPWWAGGDLVEGGVGWATGGHSEPYLAALRAVNGLIHGVKEARQGVQAVPTATIPTQQQLMRGALTPQAIASALTQQQNQ